MYILSTVPDLPLPGPWARLKFRAPSVKMRASLMAWDPVARSRAHGAKPLVGVQGAKAPEAVGFYGILSAKSLPKCVQYI